MQNCTVMTCALVNFNSWPSICSWLGKRMVSFGPQMREKRFACMYGSAHDFGCMVNGSSAIVAS